MGLDNIHVEIDQVGIVGAVSLSMADPVRIMAGAARRFLVPDMLIMIIEGLIIQDAGPAVTTVAKFIGRS